MTATSANAPVSIRTPHLIFGFVLVAIFVLPRLPFFNPPQLFTPVDNTFLHWYIGASAALGYIAFLGLFTWGNWKVAHAGLNIIIGIIGLMIAALCGMMGFLSGEQFYSYYELVHLPHERRSLLYAVQSISLRGRGGYRADVGPYGLRSRRLPLSIADYQAYHAGTLTLPGLCYRVVELRRGGIIGIVPPSEWNTPNALVRCRDDDPRRVDSETPRRL